MKHLLLIPAALVAFQAQAADSIKLPITQENHRQWMRALVKQTPGGPALAILNQDVLAAAGVKGRWKDNIDIPRGSRFHGMTAKDGSGTTWDRLDLPSGDQVAIHPFTIQGLQEEGK